MNAKEIMESDEFKLCENFHGHVCPGLSIGFMAVKACMETLKETRAEDEELVAIVETDACSADAVQVLTGCTFGKGNFIFKDYGKMALTLLSRNSGKGVRVSIKPKVFSKNDEHKTPFERSCDILEKPVEQLFIVKKVDMALPAKARIETSVPCELCGEPTMGSKLELIGDKKICRGCFLLNNLI